MATTNESVVQDYVLVDLSEEDKLAAQKYLSENGVRGIEDFLAERLDAWRKWFVDRRFVLFYFVFFLSSVH